MQRMNEHFDTQITPAEEDPQIDRWLASLPEFAPRAGFEDAVMARVYVPAPRWMQSVQSATRALFAGRRKWMWAGGLTASSAVSIAIIATLAASNWVQVETAWSLFANGWLLDAWRVAITVTAKTLGAGLALAAFWDLNFKMLIFASLAGAAVAAVSLWGLYRVLSIDTERISFDASR